MYMYIAMYCTFLLSAVTNTLFNFYMYVYMYVYLTMQLRREKIDLENTLEQEQEMLVNKLWKRMDKVRRRWGVGVGNLCDF